MRHIFVVLLVALAGCGDDEPGPDGGKHDLFPWISDSDPGSCSSASCSGCCLGSICMPGTGTSACGMGGAYCGTCQAGEICQGGTCIGGQTCDATSCPSGCCDTTGTCQNGTTESACGTGGAACKTCDSSAGEVCTQGSCGSGSGTYKVILVSAEITDSWTVCGWSGLYPEGKCDLYVILKVGNAEGQSTTKGDSHQPVWNEELLTATDSELTGSFYVQVMDEDTGPDETIDECYPKVTATDLAAGKLVDNCGVDVKNLTFEFKPN